MNEEIKESKNEVLGTMAIMLAILPYSFLLYPIFIQIVAYNRADFMYDFLDFILPIILFISFPILAIILGKKSENRRGKNAIRLAKIYFKVLLFFVVFVIIMLVYTFISFIGIL
ncbi:MAG: hypothetical protein FWC68_04100 [Oscillospiraceae bacterium]|nr:hypothetical protein [Oscillospiraceae bacterium]